jgi:hypothetical protein
VDVVEVERWWNGVWSYLGRYDLWLLECGGRWRVRVRHGDSETNRLWESRVYATEAEARALLDRLKEKKAPPFDRDFQWRDLTQRPPVAS